MPHMSPMKWLLVMNIMWVLLALYMTPNSWHNMMNYKKNNIDSFTKLKQKWTW